MKRTLLRTARSAALIYALLLVFVGRAQRLLIYHPIHRTEAAMLDEARASADATPISRQQKGL